MTQDTRKRIASRRALRAAMQRAKRLEQSVPAGTGRVFRRASFFSIAVAAAVAGGVHLSRTDALAIKTIVVDGTSAERAEQIKGLLGVKREDNLLFADLRAIRARAETHPWVAKAAVKRELPDTLRVVVETREPVMLLALDRLYYVDSSGLPFKALTPGDRYDLPVLTGLRRDDLTERPEIAREAIAGALELLAAVGVEGSPIDLDDVSEIVWESGEGSDGYAVRTLAASGAVSVIRFGTGDWARKLANLKSVQEARKREGNDAPGSIDLTYASRVIVAR